MPDRKVELRVSKYRFLTGMRWDNWKYEVAPHIGGIFQGELSQSYHLSSTDSIPKLVDKIRASKLEIVSLVPSDRNYNTGRGEGVHLDHHSGKPMQVSRADEEFLGELAHALLFNLVFI